MSTLYTIGHGTRSIDEFDALLRATGIELLVDVRRFPGSKRHPHFARGRLAEHIPASGIAYEWKGDLLGGRRKPAVPTRHPAWRVAAFRGYADHMDTADFTLGLEWLETAAKQKKLAYMCSETVWWRCHRRLISDALLTKGHEVLHIMAESKLQPHPLNPAARIGSDGRLVYDVIEEGS